MKKKYILILSIISLIFIVIISFFLFTNRNIFANSTTDLINIRSLSDEFMTSYFNEIKELNKEDNNNILIAISKKDIKDGKGATKIIKAPNNQYILVYKDPKTKDEAYKSLKQDKNILSIEENNEYKTMNNNEEINSYNSWGVEEMGFDKALNSIDQSRLQDVVVAILDTGCDMDLFNKYYNGKIVDTYSVYGDKMYDNNGHGTHIAGTIAESTGDNVKIIPVKDSDKSSITTVNIVAGLNWIIDNGNIDVVNMSFGGSKSEIIAQTIEAANQENIICVAAAGNDGVSAPSYPAALDTTISISAVEKSVDDGSLSKSDYSNFGSHITFSAPGTSIKSLNSQTSDHGSEDLIIKSGTSMATPHVVSAVALLKGFNKTLTKDQVVDLMKKSTIDLGDDGWDSLYGYGFIDFSSTNFCDGDDCDQYNVYKNGYNSSIKKIDVGSNIYTSDYNYGNNSNLFNMPIKIYYSDNDYITKDLGELKNLTIEGYDPYLEGMQEITIKYKGFSKTKMINNHTEDGWVYSDYNDGTIEITGIEPSSDYPKYIDVPATYKGLPVENLDYPAFLGREEIKTAKISAPIKWLNTSTFNGCVKLTSVELPSTIEKIYSNAFAYTPSLSSIEIPESTTEIESNSFISSGIEEITIPGSVKTINSNTFLSAQSLTNVVLENGVETIKSKAFAVDTALLSITIPKTIKNIEYNAFNLDFKLENINISNENNYYENPTNSNTIIEKNTKRLVYANDKSIIPEDVKTIGPYSLTAYQYQIPSTVTKLENNALSNSLYVIIPNSINNIESTSAFTRCNEIGDNHLNFVHENSYVHNYLKNNSIKYNLLDSEDIEVELSKTNYQAFDQVDTKDLYIKVEYAGSNGIYTDVDDYNIVYQNNNNSFRYGDTYFTVEFDNFLTGSHLSKKVNVTVSKKQPAYEIPNNLRIKQGSKVSTISLPQGFEWMDPNQVATTVGQNTFLARYTPNDTNNYEIVEDIEIPVTVYLDKPVITPNISVSDMVYNGATTIPFENISVSNLGLSEYEIISSQSSSSYVGDRTATIRLRLSDEKFENYSFADGKQEESFEVNMRIVKANINITDLTLDETIKYDGEFHTININIERPKNSVIKFINSNNEYTLDEAPRYKEIGTYTIKYRISIDNNYNDYYAQKTLIINSEIYIINKYKMDSTNKYILNIPANTELNTFTSNFSLSYGFGIDVDYVMKNNKKLVYTGGKTRITVGQDIYDTLTNVVMGDINGDGTIDSADMLKERQHLLSIISLQNVYGIAADTNKDDKIDSADLLRIRQHLLGIRSIE